MMIQNLKPAAAKILVRSTRPLRALLLPIALLIAFTCGKSSAEDLIAEVPENYRVTVQQVLLQGLSTLDRMHGQVSVKLTFENLSDTTMSVSLTDIKAKCADRKFTVTAGRQDPLIPRKPISLEPNEKATGWLKFSVYHASPMEPELRMTFNVRQQPLEIHINEAIRKTSNCTWETIGPHRMLGVVSLQRPVDGFSVWVLTDTFKELKKNGIERVIVQFVGVKETWAISSNSVSVNSVDSWLQSAANANQSNARLPFRNDVKSPVQFEMLHVVQPSTYRRPAYGFNEIRKPDLSSAIAASLRDVYQVVPADELEAAFVSPVAGIRQAAMETNLDRLPDERLQLIFDSAADDLEQQKLLAEQLHRSASPLALQFLETLARSEDPDVSQAAMVSIIKTASDSAVPAALKLWQEFEGNADWETDFANAILKEQDYRLTDVLATYAEQRLISLTSDAPSDSNQNTAAVDAAKNALELLAKRRNQPPNPATQNVQRQINTLPRVLSFLGKQDDRKFEDIAVRQLLKIKDPKIQDDLLDYILTSNTNQNRKLVDDYIAQRLLKPETADGELTDAERRRLTQKFAPRGTSASDRYSSRLFATIKRFPKPQYTERLMELSEDETLNSSSRSAAFAAALQGASPQQIDAIIESFDEMSRLRRTQTLNAFMQLRHSQWLELAERSLNVSPASAQDTLNLLQQDTSLEAALVVIRFLDTARKKAEQKALAETPAIQMQLNRQITSFTNNLFRVDHPEAHAYLNRLEKSPLIEFHDVAWKVKYRRAVSSRNAQKRREAFEYRDKGDLEAAEKTYRQIVESDPFDDAAMVSLASMCMRTDRAEEAMQLLKRAIKVSPEDVDTESFIALAMIRLGDVDNGLKHTEDTLADVPDLQTMLRMNALYNAACAYSRAAETAESDERKQRFVKKAFEYLSLSIDREEGFKDFDHALADPDLNALHDNPEWKRAIERMKVKARATDLD